MSKLQNNYTTKEQSERLLELGVSANSADCYLNGDSVIMLNGKTFQENYSEDLDLARLHLIEYPHYVPCWSVGRLIEILEITVGAPWSDKQLLGKQGTLLERVISDFEDCVKFNKIDFSKLKEV